MKKLFLLFVILFYGCDSDYNTTYSSTIETYIISAKEVQQMCPPKVMCYDSYVIWFQTNKSSESTSIDKKTYDSIHIGDTIKVLIKTITKTLNLDPNESLPAIN